MHNYNYDTREANRMDDITYAESIGWLTATAHEKLEVARKALPHWHENMINPKHPSHVQPRPESVIDLEFTRTREQKITALIALGRANNKLGKRFKLKYNYSFAIPKLKEHGVKFDVEGVPSLAPPPSPHLEEIPIWNRLK